MNNTTWGEFYERLGSSRLSSFEIVIIRGSGYIAIFLCEYKRADDELYHLTCTTHASTQLTYLGALFKTRLPMVSTGLVTTVHVWRIQETGITGSSVNFDNKAGGVYEWGG